MGATSGKADNAVQLTRALNTSTNVVCSIRTVCRAMNEAGLKAVLKERKPRLTARHARPRRDFENVSGYR